MKKYLLCCILCLMSCAVVAGCGNRTNQVETDEEIMLPDETDEETLGESTDLYEAVEQENLGKLGEIVTSEDGLYQVLIPSGWELCENKIDESMLFELQGSTEEQYMGILVLTDLAYGEFDISAFMDAYTENAREQYGNVIIGEKVPMEVNGNLAYSLKITGTLEDTEYINHIYAVDYETEKVIFTSSMYQKSEAAVAEALEDVVTSFGKVAEVKEEPLAE